MGVKKFHSVEEMKCDLWLEPGTPELWRAIEATWSLASGMSGIRFPPGVYKHRTIEESSRQREEWERRHLEARRTHVAGSSMSEITARVKKV